MATAVDGNQQVAETVVGQANLRQEIQLGKPFHIVEETVGNKVLIYQIFQDSPKNSFTFIAGKN
jgi:hypothetical protein